ncbi:MAG: response regulator transcription factor [Gammaproteobacteria bacterium]|nr:response regulator transcription factor [Gammaproteobacteria bacterium]
MNALKILLADDHDLVREGLKITLAELPGPVTPLEAASATEVMQALASHPDTQLIILDLHMPGATDLELLTDLCDAYPAIPVVVLSAEENPRVMQRAIDRGAAGFIPKSSANSVLVSALQLVLSGGVYIPSDILNNEPASATANGNTGHARGPFNLTERQTDVLELVAGGHSNKTIAKQLGLSEHTIKIHITAILRTLGVSNRTEAAIVCREHGLFNGD